MKFKLLILVLFALFSCKKNEIDIEVEIDRPVEIVSDITFERFSVDLAAKDFILEENGSLVVVGVGREENTFIKQPFILSLNSQKEISWLKFLNVDQRNLDRSVSVIPTQGGGYMVLSYSSLDNLPEFQIDLTKVNQSGYVDWNKTISEENKSLKSTSIVQLTNGDYIILSEIDKDAFSLSDDLLLSRVSTNGELIWSKVVEGTHLAGSQQVILFPDNSSFIILSEHRIVGSSKGEAKLHKFDYDGSLIWQKSIVAPGSIWLRSSKITKIGNDGFLLMFSSDTPESVNVPDVCLMKMDQDGNKEWEKTYQGARTDIPLNVIPTNDGKYIMLTNTSSFGNGGIDVMLTKLDVDGEILWEKVYGSPDSDQGANLLERSNGNLVIIGNTNHNNSTAMIFDFFLLETDNEGNPE